MKIIYLHPNNYANPHLFPTYRKTFEANGHTETINPNEATHCFVELVSGDVKYNNDILKQVFELKIPIVCFDNREYGVMETSKWFFFQHNLIPLSYIEYVLVSAIMRDRCIYFMRTMIKGEKYPDNVFPYDWAYFNGCDFPPVSKEELFNRPYDVCFIGVEAPTRRNIINGLLKDGRLKVKFKFNDHLTRLPHDQWINQYRESKLFLECDGGGLASEKFLQLFSVCPMLKNINQHNMALPFTDGINCVEIDQDKMGEEIDKIVDIVNYKEWLYDIYTEGINHMKKYYAEESVSKYVLSKINERF